MALNGGSALEATDAAEEAIGRAGGEPVARIPAVRAVLLVEGRSDRAALHAAARVLGRDLTAERIPVVAMGGITNLVTVALRAAAVAPGAPVALLADGSEERWVRGALPRIPVPVEVALCDRDLEEELLRALGTDRVLALLEAMGELAAFRVFQGQPAQRSRPVEAQLHRFLGVASGRKERMAGRLAAALLPQEVPAPIRAVLAATA